MVEAATVEAACTHTDGYGSCVIDGICIVCNTSIPDATLHRTPIEVLRSRRCALAALPGDWRSELAELDDAISLLASKKRTRVDVTVLSGAATFTNAVAGAVTATPRGVRRA